VSEGSQNVAADARVLERLVRAFSGARMMVVADVMRDRLVRGDVSRSWPEGPVPVFHVQRESANPVWRWQRGAESCSVRGGRADCGASGSGRAWKCVRGYL
jgi:hypothetical protein